MQQNKEKKTVLENELELTPDEKPIPDTNPNRHSSKKKKSPKLLKKADSAITILLRVIFAGFPSVFLTGILAGYLQAMLEVEITIGSELFFMISIPHFLIFFYAFMKTLIHFNVFTKKNITTQTEI